MGELDKAEPLAQQAYVLTDQLSETVSLARTFNNISLYYMAKGDHGMAAEILEKQAAICRKLGQRIGEAYASLNLGYNYLFVGLYQQGREALKRSLELAELTGSRRQSAYNLLNLALADIYLEDLDSGKRMLTAATEILAEIGDAYGIAISGSYMGLILEKSEAYEAARIAFQDSVAELSKIGSSGSVLDAKSGQARCAQSMNDYKNALNLATEVWEILVEQGSHGAEFPLLDYLTCAQIYLQQGEEGEFRRVLRHGHTELTNRAEKISDPEWRQSFLGNVPEHRILMSLWEEYSD
jgi:tetratricopeptide (TPR) repeat protein